MKKDNPYHIVKSRYMTEKVRVLENLKDSESNRCVRKCKTPKHVFIVDKQATKSEIKRAVEHIYESSSVKVLDVNTIQVKPRNRKVRGRAGLKASFKKAIVTFQPGDVIENVV